LKILNCEKMAESELHQQLVLLIRDWAKKNLNDQDFFLLQTDSPESNRPPNLKNCIPDVWVESENIILIGEAKTPSDYLRGHSIGQYESYLKYLHNKSNGQLVFSCNWRVIKSFRNTIKSLTSKNNIVLINDPIFLNIENYDAT